MDYRCISIIYIYINVVYIIYILGRIDHANIIFTSWVYIALKDFSQKLQNHAALLLMAEILHQLIW